MAAASASRQKTAAMAAMKVERATRPTSRVRRLVMLAAAGFPTSDAIVRRSDGWSAGAGRRSPSRRWQQLTVNSAKWPRRAELAADTEARRRKSRTRVRGDNRACSPRVLRPGPSLLLQAGPCPSSADHSIRASRTWLGQPSHHHVEPFSSSGSPRRAERARARPAHQGQCREQCCRGRREHVAADPSGGARSCAAASPSTGHRCCRCHRYQYS